GAPMYRDYADYIVRHERAPGVGLLAGWRGEDGGTHGKGAPNPAQPQRDIEHDGFWREEIPDHARYFKMANRGYLEWANKLGFIGSTAPIVLQLYSEPLQKFRLAAQGHGAYQPPAEHRERVATYFDPLPIWYEAFESAQTGATRRPSHDVPRHDETEPVSHRERGWGEGSAERQAEHIATDVQQARTNAADNGDLGRIHRPAEPSSGASRRLLPEGEGKDSFPLHAITQRPMFM